MGSGMESVQSNLVAAEAVAQEARNAANRRDANARQVVDPAIGQVLLQQFHDLPAINERLQFRRCAQVFQEISTLVG